MLSERARSGESERHALHYCMVAWRSLFPDRTPSLGARLDRKGLFFSLLHGETKSFFCSLVIVADATLILEFANACGYYLFIIADDNAVAVMLRCDSVIVIVIGF